MKKITFLFLTFLITCNFTFSKDFHKWTDDKGNVHYTTNPGFIPEKWKEDNEKIKGSDYVSQPKSSLDNSKKPAKNSTYSQNTPSINDFEIHNVESSFIRRIGYNNQLSLLFVEIENRKPLSEEYKALKGALEQITGKKRLLLTQQEINRAEFRIDNYLINKIKRPYEQIKTLELLNEYSNLENRIYMSQQAQGRNEFRITKFKLNISKSSSAESTELYQYIYFDVEKVVFDAFLLAESKGEFFNEYVKNTYAYKRIK